MTLPQYHAGATVHILVSSGIEVLADCGVVLQVVSDVLHKCLTHHHSG